MRSTPSLSVPVVEILRRLNPHWEGRPGPRTPTFRRWAFGPLYRRAQGGLAPAVILRGPRRVGKTVLVRQLLERLLEDGVAPERVLYVAFDDMAGLTRTDSAVLTVAWWFEQHVLGCTLNERARDDGPAYLLLDEVQNLRDWAPQIKHLVDNHDVRVVLTGSSSLRIEAGRDSLAGRVTTLDLGPLLLREIAGIRWRHSSEPFWVDNGPEAFASLEFWREAVTHSAETAEDRDRAFAAFSQRGAYPFAHDQADCPLDQLSAHLNETIVRRAIQHDLRVGERGRKRDPALLEEVFRLACRYAGQTPGQSVFVPEVQQALGAGVGWQRVLNYLQFLDGSLLVRLIPPLEIRLKKRKTPPKICLSDHSLRASWLHEVVPLDPAGLDASPHLSDLAGHIAESALGYFLAGIPSLSVAHFPPRASEPEVDFVVTIGMSRVPIEVKYRRRIDPHKDTEGLRAFLDKPVYNAPLGLLVTLHDDVEVLDPRIVPISLSSLLWLR